MQINLNTNNQSFGSIKLCAGAEDALRKALKPNDWVAFDKIAQAQKNNSVDINLFGRNDGGKLIGRIIPNKDNFKIEEHNQLPFFEPTIKFIDKLAKKADTIAEKIKELPAVNIDEIISKLKQ